MESVKKAKNAKKSKATKKYSAHKCDHCSKQFNDKASLLKHRPTHFDETPFACTLCDYAGKTRQYLRRHEKIMHGQEGKFSCDVCGKTFHFGCKLKDHMRVHTGEKPYKCEECDKSFNSSYSFNTHKLIHADLKPFKCSFCPYACRDGSTLRKHHARHMGQVTHYQCNMCDVSCKSKARLKVHVAEKHFDVDMKKMECNACGKRFKFRNELVTHIRVVHEKSTRGKCDVCGVVISNRGNLKSHMRIHVDMKPFMCTFEGCDKRYKDTSSLAKHTIVHYPEKHFACKICDRRFAREKRMRAHLSTHTAKVKSVECDYCGVSFYNKNYLTTHIQRKHGKKKQCYICDICGLRSTNKPSIVMHLKYGHHPDKVTELKCDFCEKSFNRDVNLKLHYWMAHNFDFQVPKRRKVLRRRKKPKPLVVVKEEPLDNGYEGGVNLHVSPKIEPLDDEGLEELNLTGINRTELEDIPKEMIEDLITPVIKGKEENRRSKYKEGDFVDKKSEEQVKKVINSILEKTRRKIAAQKLERVRRKYNKLIRRAVKVRAIRKARNKKITNKNKHNANSLLVEDFSIDQTIEKDIITDKANVNDVEKRKIANTKRKERRYLNKYNKNDKEKHEAEKGHTNESFEKQDKDVEENGTDLEGNDEETTEDVDEVSANEKSEAKGQNRKLKINTHQCYVCFKLYQTKKDLLEHCQEHFDLCNMRTLKKCPLCEYTTDNSVTTHLKRHHDIHIKVPKYGHFKDNNETDGSKYYYEVNDRLIKKVEIIPSVKHLNKRESLKIDKKNRENKNKNVVKNKLVKKGKEWIVMTEKIKVNDYILPKFDKIESNNVKGGYLDKLKELYQVAKKEGKKMLFPCDSCDKVCQTLSALTLHGRKHEANPKPFKPKVWKHKNKNPNDNKDDPKAKKVKEAVMNKDNRTAKPKPVVNNHKCDKELIEFYNRNIRGSDIEFWQFLKIYNKMGRENVNDFDDLQKSDHFGLHCNDPEENTSVSNDLRTNDDSGIKVTNKTTGAVKKAGKRAFTRVMMLSKREMMKREEVRRRLREKIKQQDH